MLLLSAKSVSRQFDAEPVFHNVSFEIRTGEKVGLVGPNGTGKTTLMNILAGLDEPDEGVVETHSSAQVALLEQQADFAPGRTLLEEARSGLAHLYRLQSESLELAEQMAGGHDAKALEGLQKRYDALQQELHRMDAYNVDHRVDEVLQGLGFTPDQYDRPLAQFSGGQQNRALLVRLLLRAPDLMLLDEPTNHLDIAATEWLEDYLSRCRQAVILVSHDRYFLDRVTTRILEMQGGVVTDYPGNFTAYWSQREERHKVLQRTYEKQQEFIAKTEDFIARNRYGQKHAQAADREKKLERLQRVELPQDIGTLPMNFGQPTRTGDWVIDAVGLSKGYDGPLFTDFTLQIERGDRIGMFGPNGSGKTTLLRTLIGELQPDAGTLRFGTNVKIGYFDQHLTGVDPNADAIEAVRPPDNPAMTAPQIRELLARFGIRGDMVFRQVGSMSGGERNKVELARLAALNANVLVLDEPTNHLDLWARDSLESALKAFDGTIVFVSHDRYFLDRLAAGVIVLEPGQWRFYHGNYSDYLQFKKNLALETQANGSPRKSADEKKDTDKAGRTKDKESRRKRKFPYRKIEEIEAEITEHESLLEQLQADLASPEVQRDGRRVKETMQAYEDAQTRLDALYEHWEEAAELN
jgi:ATP-binding cassette, subfamily F, member 3